MCVFLWGGRGLRGKGEQDNGLKPCQIIYELDEESTHSIHFQTLNCLNHIIQKKTPYKML